MGYKFSTINRSCVIVCLAVLELRMFAASPASVSAPETEDVGQKGVFQSPEVRNPPELVSEEMQYEYEPNERQKQESWFRNSMGNTNYEAGNDRDALDKECGVKMIEYLRMPTERRDLDNVCNRNLRGAVKDVSIYSDDERKCNSFLCAWYSEQCNEIMHKEHKFNSKDISAVKETDIDPALQKCKCFFRIWNQHGCDDVLSARDKLDKATRRKDHYLNHRHKNEVRMLDEEVKPAPVHGLAAEGSGKAIANVRADEEGYQNDQADSDSVVFLPEDDGPKTWERPMPIPKLKKNPFDRKSYSEEQRKCFAFKNVWYGGKCYKLNSVEACPQSGQWLVLEKPVTEADDELLKPVCKTKPCPNDELYWPSLRRCSKTTEAQKTCTGKGELAKADAFGDGFCTCDDESGTFENNTDCHIYYQQGPCTRDQVVTYNPVTGYAVCSPDLCTKLNNPVQPRGRRSTDMKHHISKYGDTSPENINSDTRVREREGGVFKRDVAGIQRKHNKDDYNIGTKEIDPYKFEYENGMNEERLIRQARQTSNKKNRVTTRKPTTVTKKFYGPMDGTGTCYRLGSTEPCTKLGPDFYFKVDTTFHHPRCTEGTLELHLIDSRPGCKVDETNNCREEVKLAETNEVDFLLSLKKQARRKRAVKK